jgi:hypothetical protein
LSFPAVVVIDYFCSDYFRRGSQKSFPIMATSYYRYTTLVILPCFFFLLLGTSLVVQAQQSSASSSVPSSTPLSEDDTLRPTFDPDDRILFNVTVDLTKLGAEIRCTEMNAQCRLSGEFRNIGGTGGTVNDDGIWTIEDNPEGTFLRVSWCVDPFCSALCDPVCSCVVGDPSFEFGPPCGSSSNGWTVEYRQFASAILLVLMSLLSILVT